MPANARSRVTRAFGVLGGGALVAASLLAIAQPAQASVALKCGATITRSVTLSQNINCAGNSANDAVTILAAGVTINLNGHKILGPGDSKDTGGVIDNGHDNVTVENGTIANFWVGVNASGSSTAAVTGLRIQNVTITENTLGDQNYGVFGTALYKASMTGLLIRNANTGVELSGSAHCTIARSYFASPLTGFMDETGNGNALSHSIVSDASYEGVYVLDSTRAVITFNTITGANAWGVYDQVSDLTSIAHNRLSNVGTGVESYDSTRETVSSNSGSGDAYGIYADNPVDDTYAGNVFSKGQYGIQTNYPRGVVLKQNTTDGNSVAGIYVYWEQGTTGDSATLSRNTADKNQFGLYSLIHTKGGSNHAAGNTVVNCHNVSCVKK